jgi:hypothetical protein
MINKSERWQLVEAEFGYLGVMIAPFVFDMIAGMCKWALAGHTHKGWMQ